MQWELRGDRPIYQQLVEKLTEQIVSGQLAAGEKVPPVRELAAQAGVNPNTMQPCACGNGARGPDVHQPHERTLCNGGQRNDW